MKGITYNEKQTTELYFLMIKLEVHQKNIVKAMIEDKYQLYNEDDLIEANKHLNYIIELKQFFREAKETMINELPF